MSWRTTTPVARRAPPCNAFLCHSRPPVSALRKRAGECGCYGVAFPQKVDTASLVVSIGQAAVAGWYLWAAAAQMQPISVGWRAPGIVVMGASAGWLLWRIIGRRWREVRLRRMEESRMKVQVQG